MLSILVKDDWHELDTLNGYYRLDDLWKGVGSPEGLDPRTFVEATKPHTLYTIQIRKHVWSGQAKLYEYAAFLDPAFKAILETYDLELFKTVTTGVT